MGEELGHVAYEREAAPFMGPPEGAARQPRRYGEATAREIDRAVRDLASAAFERAIAILERHRRTLEEGARPLLEKETLDEDDLARLGPADLEKVAS